MTYENETLSFFKLDIKSFFVCLKQNIFSKVKNSVLHIWSSCPSMIVNAIVTNLAYLMIPAGFK
jgi:hypothetical protein